MAPRVRARRRANSALEVDRAGLGVDHAECWLDLGADLNTRRPPVRVNLLGALGEDGPACIASIEDEVELGRETWGRMDRWC